MYQEFFKKVKSSSSDEMIQANLVWLVEFLDQNYKQIIASKDTPAWDEEAKKMDLELFPFYTDGISLGNEWEGATELLFEQLEKTHPDTFDKIVEKLGHIIDVLAMVAENEKPVDEDLMKEFKNLPAAFKLIELSM